MFGNQNGFFPFLLIPYGFEITLPGRGHKNDVSIGSCVRNAASARESPCAPIGALLRPISAAEYGQKGRIYKNWLDHRARSAKTGIATTKRPYGTPALVAQPRWCAGGGTELPGRQHPLSYSPVAGSGESGVEATLLQTDRTGRVDSHKRGPGQLGGRLCLAAQASSPPWRRADRVDAGAPARLDGALYGGAAAEVPRSTVFGCGKRYCKETSLRMEELEISGECYECVRDFGAVRM